MSLFSPFKKLANLFSPKSSFVAPAPAPARPPGLITPPPVVPPRDAPDVIAPRQPSHELTFKQKILAGLPGFLGSAGSVMASKAVASKCIAGLCAGSSPLALAAAGVLGSAAVGGVAAQTAGFVKERWALAEQQSGQKIRARDLIKNFSLAAAGRELGAYGQELKTKKFWQGAAKKGGISAVFGAASGLAIAEGADWVKDHVFAKPVPPLASLTMPATIPAAPAQDLLSLPKDTLVNDHRLETTAPDFTPLPLNVETSLDHARGFITEDSLAAEMLARADQGNAQAIKDLAVGFNNGKFGVPLNKELAHLLFEKAAALGNAQALHDLGRATAETAHTALPLVATAPADALLAPPGVSDESRASAAEYLRTLQETVDAPAAPVGEDVAAAPAAPVEAALPATPPARLGQEAMRCVTEVQEGPVSRAVNSICSIWKSVVERGDQILIGARDAHPQAYIYDGAETVPTQTFLQDSLVNFASQPR